MILDTSLSMEAPFEACKTVYPLPGAKGLSYSDPFNDHFEFQLLQLPLHDDALVPDQETVVAAEVQVCMLTALSSQMSIQPVLLQLHWLSIVYWIQFKVLDLAIKALYN